jgi:hypothetical protein
MLFPFNANRLKALQVNLLGIAGVWLQNHLQLVMLLHPVGVVAKAAIIGADARFDVDHVPRFRPKDAQNGGGVHGSCADLHVVRLPDQTALLFPEIEQAENDIVKSEFVGVAHNIL